MTGRAAIPSHGSALAIACEEHSSGSFAERRLARMQRLGTLVVVSRERNLQALLASIEPELRPGTFVFVVVQDEALLDALVPEATIREPEGLTAVVRRENADAVGLSYDYLAAWITLRVHSALDAVGLTAAVSTALAGAGLSCNVLAGYHHDHLLVPADRAQEALKALSDLSRTAGDGRP